MHYKALLGAAELEATTHAEIFRTAANGRKPLNYMNYSHCDYELISGAPLAPHTSEQLPGAGAGKRFSIVDYRGGVD
jgi:hypothetical protein